LRDWEQVTRTFSGRRLWWPSPSGSD